MTACSHKSLLIRVDMPTGDSKPGFNPADIEIVCDGCGEPFTWIGGGVMEFRLHLSGYRRTTTAISLSGPRDP